jgi:4-diphosphocytidyl-2-C-methyl-D-erythritol kinase
MRLERTQKGLRVLAPAKLNLYLEVGPKRPDGYHEIDSLFQAVSLFDELELLEVPGSEITLEEEGISLGPGNLVLTAARRLQEGCFPSSAARPGARIRLRKSIPQGAGLGGGSSDAAATLVGLSVLWGIPPEAARLQGVALSLGSDVPFFLVGGTARCRGRGERVESWAQWFDPHEPFHYVLVYPKLNISTKLVYDTLDAVRGPNFALTAPSPLDSMHPESVKTQLDCGKLFYNRFESVVYKVFPELQSLHDLLTGESLLKVLMSGSGSTVYGVCRSAEEAESIARKLKGHVPADVFTARSEPRHGWVRGF